MHRIMSRSNTFAPYFYMDESDYKFKLGDLATAKQHKFEFNEYEINWLRWENKDFDLNYEVVKVKENKGGKCGS